VNSNYFTYQGATYSKDIKLPGFTSLLRSKGYKYELDGGNIKGIDSTRLANSMISKGIFER
jgi:hypothetical protein